MDTTLALPDARQPAGARLTTLASRLWRGLRRLARRRTVPAMPTRLPAGRALALPRHGGVQLSVRAGRLWLTRSGECADHWLGTGEGLWLDRGDGWVIEADGEQAAWLAWTTAHGATDLIGAAEPLGDPT